MCNIFEICLWMSRLRRAAAHCLPELWSQLLNSSQLAMLLSLALWWAERKFYRAPSKQVASVCSSLISTGKFPAVALFRIPIARSKELKATKQSPPQRWEKDESRKHGHRRYSSIFNIIACITWGCKHFADSKNTVGWLRFLIFVLNSQGIQNWYDFRKSLRYLPHLLMARAVAQTFACPKPPNLHDSGEMGLAIAGPWGSLGMHVSCRLRAEA